MSRAESRPRRWPDLLIGLLVLLLLAGFALLLLGQRRAEVAQAPAPAATEPAPVIPGAPGTDIVPDNSTAPAAPVTEAPAPSEGEAGSGETETRPETPATSTTPAPVSPAPATANQPAPEANPPASTAPAAPAATPTTPPQATAPAANPTDPGQTTTPPTTPTAPSNSGAVPVVAADPIPAAPSAPPAPAVTLPTPPANPTLAQPQPAQDASTPATPTAPPRSGGAVATSEQRTPLRSDYRISLGTFGSETLAQSRTSGVRALGYTVYPIDLGSQVVAQVGPFADEGTARQALADIQRAYPGAILYPPRNRSLTGAADNNEAAPSSPPTAPDTSSENTATTPDTSEARPQPAPSGPVYLQVGAFDRVESAQNLVGQLREQGYAPTVNAPEGRKVTVLIGPFNGAALTSAEEKLDANGFDHFRVR
ncbi:hypothetical protein Dcar01_02187 [Deinococcus carri]|uniref:SPOR domain-containing protein n=1 Tax=Deinococcus carri TaxID=1211323 RepID=A0ABP9W7X7_9DEIO